MLASCCRRLIRYQSLVLRRGASYYERPKAKRGPSGQAWLALAGVTTTLTGVSIYLLGEQLLESVYTARG